MPRTTLTLRATLASLLTAATLVALPAPQAAGADDKAERWAGYRIPSTGRAAGGWIGLAIAGILGLPFVIAVPEFLVPGAVGFLLAGGGLTALSWRQARRARLVEEITVWPEQIEIVSTGADQNRQMRRFAPQKVRLMLTRDEDERTTAMHLMSGAERLEIGRFLAVSDKSSFARAFGQALRKARRG